MTKTKFFEKKKSKKTSMATLLATTPMSSDENVCNRDDCLQDDDFYDAEEGDADVFNGTTTEPSSVGDKGSASLKEEEALSHDVRYRLHKSIFERQPLEVIEKTLQSFEDQSKALACKDIHGNTPLHLAVMLGLKDIIEFLIDKNSPTKARNVLGWTVLDEAVSYGNRDTIKSILRLVRKQNRLTIKERQPAIMKALKAMSDFEMELRWEFYSWLPIVKRFLPSDTCRIWKRGHQVRLDTTLVDFSDRSWQRGNLTILFNGETHGLVMLDNDMKVFQSIRFSSDDDNDLEFEADSLMSTDIIYPHFSTKDIHFSRAQGGWFFNKYDKTEKVGEFLADFYNVNGFVMESRKRREHLTDEDVIKNKALFDVLRKTLDKSTKENNDASKTKRKTSNASSMAESMSMCDHLNGEQEEEGKMKKTMVGSNSCSDMEMDGDEENGVGDELDHDTLAIAGAQLPTAPNSSYTPRRKSLSPPPPCSVTWAEYMSAVPGKLPSLARPLNVKVSHRTFKPTLAMSKDFPFSLQSLLSVLEVIAPLKHFNKLREFVQLQLPPGFPVKIDIPLFPTILARATFLSFQFRDNNPASLFEIPEDYEEDPTRFPDI